MATTLTSGIHYSDTPPNIREDISQEMMALNRADVPFLNAIGFGDLARAVEAEQPTHKWPDLAYLTNECVLNTTIAAGTTTIVFTAKGFLAGDEIVMDGEPIRLGDMNADGVTFGAGGTVCVRGLGASSGAAHTAGAVATLINRKALEGAAAGTPGPAHEGSNVTNYCQIFHRDVSVSWQSDRAPVDGFTETNYDRRVKEYGNQMKLEIQASMYGGPLATAHAPGTTSEKGAMKGAREFILGASNYTAMSGGNITESALATAGEALSPYQDINGFRAVMMIPVSQVKVLQNWQTPHVQGSEAELAGRYGVEVFQIRCGLMLVDVVPWRPGKSWAEAMIFLPSFVRPVIQKGLGFAHTAQGIDGQRKKGFLSCTASVEVHGEGKTGYLLTGVAV